MDQKKLLQFYRLKEDPFRITPNPRFLYMTTQHQEAIEACRYVIDTHGGLVVVHGQIGTGKSTIVRYLFDSYRDSVDANIAMLITPDLRTDNAFLKAIMEEFDVKPGRSFHDSLKAFQRYIYASREQKKNVVVVVDEAQKLTPKMFDVIHALHNFESNEDKFLQIVLIGQEELAGKVDRLPAIRSRVVSFNHLTNLTPDDCREMIAFRWRTASGARGGISDPFTEDALEAIYWYSHGLPREVVKLCSGGLLRAFAYNAEHVNREMIGEAAGELRLDVNREEMA